MRHTIRDLGPDALAAVPARSAVRHVQVSAEEQGQRLDRVLGRLLPGVPRTRIFRLIRRGEVRVNGRRASPEQRLVAGDAVRVPPVREAAADAPRTAPAAMIQALERAVIHEDERLLVLDKPAGIAVHGGSGLSFGVIEALRASRPHEELELAHRLDRETSGVLLVARRRSALRTLHALLREGAVQKSYLALVAGRWQLGHRRIDAPLRTDARVSGERTVRVDARAGKQALTEFRLVEHCGSGASLIEATLHTGRTHQIRVHAAHCGHPIAGDPKYGDAAFNAALAALGLKRMFLHAHSCSFTWPESGAEQSFNAPLPAPLKAVLEQLAAPRRGGRERKR
ncbi:MAG TPA: RluA family pseudouridine synthase [Steroidobacteraceae bacterium]|nr:RluA family pseudouridine synthase [Steroidobacteraceae bacterium]